MRVGSNGVICLEAVAQGSVDASSSVVPVPARIDAAVATSYLNRRYANS